MMTSTARQAMRPADQTTILLVAVSSARRALLAEILEKAFPRASVNVLSSAGFSFERAHLSRADVVLVDLDTTASAERILRFVKTLPAGVGSVALMDDPERTWVSAALHAGVNAIIARDAGPDELRLAVEASDQGLVLLHPASARALAARSLSTFQPGGEVEHLTPRERGVLRLISDGLGNKEIAARLGISENTVKFHTSSILGKLGAATRTEAVSRGIRRGMITL